MQNSVCKNHYRFIVPTCGLVSENDHSDAILCFPFNTVVSKNLYEYTNTNYLNRNHVQTITEKFYERHHVFV